MCSNKLNPLDNNYIVKESYPIPKNILIVNLNTLQTIFEGNHKSAVVMINQFTKDYQKDLDSIRRVLFTKNKQEIYNILHYFKGPMSYLGADRILNAIDMLMTKNEDNKDVTIQDYEMLELELNQFVDEIKKIEMSFLAVVI